MNLTRYTDFALRTLILVGMHRDRLTSIQEVSDAYGISRNHLIKVVHHLGRHGFLETVRGRGGGLRLGREPADIRIGDVVRVTEPGFELLECFDAARDRCPITPACRLKGILAEALEAFLEVIDRHTLADLLGNKRALGALLGLPKA